MKLLLGVIVAIISANAALPDNALWKDYKAKHQKVYQHAKEESKRFSIFQNNLVKIAEHNARFAKGLTTYKKGMNRFTDMTPEEFSSMLNLQKRFKPIKAGNRTVFRPSGDAPESIDWRTSGVVTDIKDQGSCGGCWAFSATGATEAAYAIKTGQLVSLSEQQLIDCSKVHPYDLGGCNGGLMEPAFDYIKDHGIESEEAYPYEAVDNTCRANGESVTTVTGYVDVAEFEEDDLVNAVGTVGPVSVAIDATDLQSYESGIFDGYCSYYLNHGVLAVGYGSEDDQAYWLVKNSWGTSWGDAGYFKLQRGVNHCGIAIEPSYPTI